MSAGVLAGQRRGLLGMGATILALLVIGWGGLGLVVASGSVGAGAGFGLGLGWTVFALGMRHAFDADHIAAIDNAARSLVGAGRSPVSVGFWFSLGHSSVVFGASALLAAGVRGLANVMVDGSARLRQIFDLAGTSVSTSFLLILGLINAAALVGLVRLLRGAGRQRFDQASVDEHLDRRGLLFRLFGRRLSRVARPWQMYPIGLLFGIGFDTATEIGLFALAGAAATLALPWYAVLILPVIFASGMALFDTIDGIMMSYTYSWANAGAARRRLVINVAVTGLSAAFALVIGLIQAASLVSERVGLSGGLIGSLGEIDLSYVGYAAVVGFTAIWGAVLVVGRRGSPPLARAALAPPGALFAQALAGVGCPRPPMYHGMAMSPESASMNTEGVAQKMRSAVMGD